LVFLVFPPNPSIGRLDIALFRMTRFVWVSVFLANNLPSSIERFAIKALIFSCAFALYLFYQFD